MQQILSLYFSTTFLFLIQYCIGTIPFLADFPRGKGFWTRLCLWLPLFLISSFLIAAAFFKCMGTMPWDVEKIFVCIFFFLLVLLFVLMITRVFRISFGQAFFIAAGGYSIEHISEMVSQILLVLRSRPDASSVVFTTFLRIGVSLAVSFVFYFGLIRKANRDGIKTHQDKRIWVVSFVNLFICIILNVFSTPVSGGNTASIDSISTIAYKLYAIVGCSLCILLQMNFFRENRLSAEKEELREVLDISRKQQRISKETIDLINIKCHDIKYHIQMLGKEQNAESVRKMTELISIYDSIYKTGNDTLDLVLMEKKLLCEGKEIEFKIVADGKQLDFMDDGDIYILFGNLLDNAVESSVKNPKKENRFIRLNIYTRGEILYINEENDCTEQPEIDGDYPKTTHTEKNGHGYGVRSMDYLVRQYGGEIVFEAENGLFRVEIMIPIPGGKRQKA